MLDKLLLNNQIITNKKKIQQARSQTINKLVQKIRKLKTLSDKNPNNVRITEKLSKILKIMVCVKKIKTADIIRKILILSKKPSAILTNGRAPPDDIAAALLANNKILASIVSSLKGLLHLDDNNIGWKDAIMELSRRKKRLLKDGERKKTPKVDKKTKKNLWKEENLQSTHSEILSDNDDAKGWKIEPIQESAVSIKPKQVAVKTVTTKDAPNEINSVEHQETFIENPLQQKQKPVKIVDSFFITETGDNYLSTVVIDRVQPEVPDDGLIRRERRDNTKRSYQRNNNNYIRQKVANGRVDQRQSFTPNVRTEITDEKLHPSWAAKQKLKPTITQFKGKKITFDDDGKDNTVKSSGKNINRVQDKTVEKIQSGNNLHPSWAAKQKHKPTIKEFKGNKITFDD